MNSRKSYQINTGDCVLLPEEICYMNWQKYYMDYHEHPAGSIEFNYIVDGNCYYDIDGEIYELGRKNLLIVNGSTPHKLISPDSCINMSINFYQSVLTPAMGSLSSLTLIYPALQDMFSHLHTGMVIKNAKSLFPLLQEIYNETNNKKDLCFLNILVNKTLIEVLRLKENEKEPADYYVEQVKNYINYHFFSIHNIEEIASHVSLHKVYLQRIFKEKTGVTVWDYLTRYRMEKAAYFLVYSDTPISDIDELVGVNSRQNFYVLFKKIYKVSPSQYRKKFSNYACIRS